ncbi:DUF4129 domain-containing protein [Roseiconus lacunae]|uniref:DUF4129 domain-containing protein n=1 Tax=Roseiconus lacunae TaxID=2605694 RepID=A0ABT7PJT1_9BACT|nr:DUF4129 domain-containing protein [Roseiconus lacunae]MDM4016747.1 DUF4129 domain-containing protein [Roseiconus lacunae]
MSRRPQLADYAAIAVSPVLIFLMISSLASFFVMLFTGGQYQGRLSYLIVMYTMGAVACARIVIEFDRSYAAAYTFGLGAAMFFVSWQFFGSPVFSLGFIVLIAFLADRITHDCTLIDEKTDASGEGLIDRGLDEIKMMREGVKHQPDDRPQSEQQQRRKRSHQPGRTVFLLALAALPLFGIGQFVMRNHPAVWSSAKFYLGVYLFASLSLLVTTSFLNLRRYLRQREVDMPGDVTVAWLAGGIGLIAALLMLSYLAPLPGSAIASVSMPEFLKVNEMTASRYGWGDDAAEKSDDEGDAQTGEKQDGDKQSRGSGDNENDPKESGGSRPADQLKPDRGDAQSGEQTSSQKSGSGPSDQQSSASQNQRSDSKQAQSMEQSQKAGQQSSGDQKSEQSKSRSQADDASESASNGQTPQDKQASQGNQTTEKKEASGDRSADASQQSDQSKQQGNGNPDSESSDSSSTDQQSQSGDRRDASSDRQAERSTASKPSSSMPSIGGLFSALGSLLKFVLILVLAGIVLIYLYQMRERIRQWLASLFGSDEEPVSKASGEKAAFQVDAPPRPFDSFQNPLVPGADPKRVVVITFQAFEAWARERGCARRHDETPSEFMARLRSLSKHNADAQRVFASVGPAADRLGNAYDRIVYGRGVASRRDVEATQTLWQQMTRQVPSPPASSV